MSVKKREDSPFWQCEFSIGGQRIRESTGTTDRELAEQYEAARKKEIWEQQRLGAKPKRSWCEAVIRWSKEKGHKRSFKDDQGHLRWLDPYLSPLTLDQINEDVLEGLIQAKLGADVEPSTVNRVIAVVRGIMRSALLQWKWITQIPTFRTLDEDEGRIRWITEQEAAKLLNELPIHQAFMAEFTLETGLRARNVRELRWSQVDLQRRCCWVVPEDAKNGSALAVPLSERAVEIIRAQIGKHIEFVFTYQQGTGRKRPPKAPRPITGQLSTKAWHKALKRAGIEDFRWHDLRHTWASWHVQRGTPLRMLMELGGWKDFKMVLRYSHLNAEHLRPYVERGTNLTHVMATQKESDQKAAISA